jgi:hypothetical protein
MVSVYIVWYCLALALTIITFVAQSGNEKYNLTFRNHLEAIWKMFEKKLVNLLFVICKPVYV